MNLSRTALFFIFLIAVFGLCLRLDALRETRRDLFREYIPPHDSFFNIRAAEESVAPVYPEPVSPFVPETPYKAFLQGMFRLFGTNLFLVRLFQILISTGTCWVLYRIGARLGHPLAGTAAAFFWAFQRQAVLYDLQILKYSLTFSMTLVTLLLWIRFAEKPDLKRLCAAFLSVLVLGKFRAFYYFLVFFLPFHLPFFRKRTRGRTLLKWSIPLVAVPLAVSLWALHAPPPAKTHPAIHIYQGFHRFARGFYVDLPFVRDNTLGHFQEGVNLALRLSKEYPRFAFLDNFWLQRAAAYIVDNPYPSVRLVLKKTYALFFHHDWQDTVDILVMLREFRFARLAFVRFEHLLPFALAGLIFLLAFSRDKTLAGPVLLFLAFPVLSVAATCLTRRYQAQLVPVLCVLAGFGVCFLADCARKGRWKRLAAALFCMLPLWVHAFCVSGPGDHKLSGRTSYLEYRLEHNRLARGVYLPWIFKATPPVDFADALETWKHFMEAGNTVDALGLLALAGGLARSAEEKSRLFEAYGDTYSAMAFFDRARGAYRKASRHHPSPALDRKIEEAGRMAFIRNAPSSYP
jgi:hypothetical protein